MMKRLCFYCILGTVTSMVCLLECSIAESLDVVALSGQLAPISGIESRFSSAFGSPILHHNGDILFDGTISGDGVDASNNSTLWIRRAAGRLEKIAREGETPSGASDGTAFSRFQNPVLKGNGMVAFTGTLMGPDGDDKGIWKWREGIGLEQVALEGNAIRSINNYAMNNDGVVAFSGSANGQGFGVWVEQEGQPSLLASTGNELPAGDGALYFGVFNQPVVNDSGDVAFHSSLVGPNLDANNDDAVWVYQNGQGLRKVARAGEHAPGTTEDTFFKGIYPTSVVLNNAGTTAFAALLIGPDIDTTKSTGIWIDRGEKLEAIAVATDPAPDTDGDVNFERLSAFALNHNGDIVLRAALEGADVTIENNQGIWTDRGGGILRKIVQKGDPAPGTDAGVNFSILNQPLINGHAKIAFQAAITEAGRNGIWAEDRHGVLTLIAKEGGLIDVNVGPQEDLRTISRLSLSGGFTGNSSSVGGRSTGFNDLGQIAFAAGFTDGSSGVFVSNLVAIPEPNALVLAVGSFAVLTRRVRRNEVE